MSSSGRVRRRIAFLDNFPRLGGAERSLVDLLSHIDRDRFEPCLVTAEAGPLSREVARLDVPVHFCPLPSALSGMSRTRLGPAALCRTPLPVIDYLGRLARLLRTLRPDITCSNSFKDHVASGLLAAVRRRNVLWHFRDVVESRALRNFMETVALVSPVHLVTNSNFTASQFPRLSRRPGKTTVVYNGMDLAEIDRRRCEPPDGELPATAPDDLVVGIVGALCPEKGQELLVRALAAVADETNVSCWIVGEEIYETARHARGYRDRLETIARDLGVRERVHFLGWRRDVISVVARMDVLVCASDPARFVETFGRTVTEAMACGRAVVSVARGGPLETVVDGETGLLFDEYTPDALAGAILTLARDRERMERMGRAGRERVERLFTIETYVRGIEACIDRVLADRTGGDA